MVSQIITTDNLISNVRSLLDEDNKESVTDADDIIPALNRGQNYAASILARHYEDSMLVSKIVPMVSGQIEYNIPEDSFEQRLEAVEVIRGTTFQLLTRIDYRDIGLYENSASTTIPYYYAVRGDRYRIVPASNAAYSLRIWYLKDPLPLVKSQGRINTVNTGSNYIIVDSIGSDVTTEVDNLNSYVNIIDAQTGKRKATLQVKTISGNKITFKTSPSRTNVLNTTIDTDMANLSINDSTNEGPDYTINQDDYVSVITGSAVPFFKKPFSNFLVQYAVAEIRRKLGGPADLAERVLKKFEDQVESTWASRESTLRVKKASGKWSTSNRRFYGTSNN